MNNNTLSEIVQHKKPFLIAEIGVNFYDIAKIKQISPLEAAFMMIEEAARSGADAAKFQSYKAKNLAIKNSPSYWDLRKEPSTSQFDLFSKFDSFGVQEYKSCAEHCKKNRILFLSTPFDFNAADYLNEICPFFKISSSDITNWPFLAHIAKKGKPIVLSTGASNLKDIREAVNIIESNGCHDFSLLHCVLSYPTKYKDANLNMIESLKKEFNQSMIGYSDHTLPDSTMTCLVVAYQRGAVLLEKHFTLDKNIPGNDHYHAMDSNDIITFKKNILDPEFQPNAKILSKILGETQKRCLPCEESARLNARRSIVAKVTIHKGQMIDKESLTFKRPGTGISPRDVEKIINHTATVDIKEDAQITFEQIN